MNSVLPTQKTLIRVGHSPDPDDAFMFYALAKDLIDTGRYQFTHELVDIETLNRRAFSGELELTALRGLEPRTLLALAMRDLGANAGKIGNLTITSEMLASLLREGNQ